MFKPDRINIHELTIEEPEKQSELPFDPERDITKQDWEVMRLCLEHSRKNNTWSDFSAYAARMKILDPTQDLNLDQTAWQGMEDEFKKQSFNPQRLTSNAADMKVLDPKRDLNLDQTAWTKMRRELENWRSKNDWGMFSWQASNMKIIDPKINLKLDQAAWQGMEKQLEEYRRSNNWTSFFLQASRMKILDPKIDLKLDQTAWQGARDELEVDRRQFMMQGFDSLAKCMKILVAERVDVTDQGLEITMPKREKPLTSVPPIPETKQF